MPLGERHEQNDMQKLCKGLVELILLTPPQRGWSGGVGGVAPTIRDGSATLASDLLGKEHEAVDG